MSPMISKRNLALCDNLTCSSYSHSESLWRFFVCHVNCLTRSLNYDLWFQNLWNCCVKSGVGRGKEDDLNTRRDCELMTFKIVNQNMLMLFFASICNSSNRHDDPGSGCERLETILEVLSCRNIMSVLGLAPPQPWSALSFPSEFSEVKLEANSICRITEAYARQHRAKTFRRVQSEKRIKMIPHVKSCWCMSMQHAACNA